MKEVKQMIPGVEYYQRDNHMIKKVIEEAKEKGFTDLMLIYEKMGKPRKSIPFASNQTLYMQTR